METQPARAGTPRPKSLMLIGAVICFALGIGATILYQSWKASPDSQAQSTARQRNEPLDSIAIAPLAPQSPPDALPPTSMPRTGIPRDDETDDVLAEARRMMNSFFEEELDIPAVSSMPGNQISRREDREHVFYDVPIAGLKKEDLHVQVGDGMITISGKIEREDLFSTFSKSFSIPEGVDAARVQIKPETNKLVIEFPKRS